MYAMITLYAVLYLVVGFICAVLWHRYVSGDNKEVVVFLWPLVLIIFILIEGDLLIEWLGDHIP